MSSRDKNVLVLVRTGHTILCVCGKEGGREGRRGEAHVKLRKLRLFGLLYALVGCICVALLEPHVRKPLKLMKLHSSPITAVTTVDS